jgi:chromosome segregation ATPase
MKEELNKADSELKIYKEKISPVTRNLENKKKELEEINKERNELNKQMRENSSFQKITSEIYTIGLNIEKQANTLGNVEKEIEEKEERLKTLKMEINKRRLEYENLEFKDKKELFERNKIIKDELDKVQQDYDKASENTDELKQNLKEKEKDVSYVRQKIRDLDSVTKQRVEIIKRDFPEVYKVYTYVMSNEKMFNSKIYLLLLELNINKTENVKIFFF